MSDIAHTADAAHAGPIKNPKQLLLAVLLAFVVPIFAIIGLVRFVSSAHQEGVGAFDAEMAKARRLQKIGQVQLRLSDENRPLQSGEAVYQTQCMACHASGVSGAPKFADAAEWGPRLAQGLQALAQASIGGKGAMPPQGGGNFNDVEIARAVVYMANAAGASFEEPQPPAAEGEEGAAGADESGAAAAPAEETGGTAQ